MKIRFVEPGNRPYRPSPLNAFVYERYIRTPSNGIITLATIAHGRYEDVLCYSESISRLNWQDITSSDVVCISIFSFAANRGYQIADAVRAESDAVVVFGGLHATLVPEEALAHADYVLMGEGDETIVPLLEAIEADGSVEGLSGVMYRKDGVAHLTSAPQPPHEIDVIPDRYLMHDFKRMASRNTIWPQVHASRGCPHHCDYCGLVAAFGRGVRCRPPESVVDDIRQAIAFFDEGHHRIAKMLWITDDNFFANRSWALAVLQEMIDSGIRYNFTIQARYEVGFDDEMLELLRKAGFSELAMGIEFLDDESFSAYNKKSTRSEIIEAIANIKRHGLRVRGLFIVGADNHKPGIGRELADFVIEQGIDGVLIQSMYFIPGTPVYETHKHELIESSNWARCTGAVVHRPKQMSAASLQEEIIAASKRIYSVPRLLNGLVKKRGMERILLVGEFFWHMSIRHDLRRELPFLRKADPR